MLPFEQTEEKHPGNQSHPQPGAGRRMKRVLLPAPGHTFAPCPVSLFTLARSGFCFLFGPTLSFARFVFCRH